MMDIQEPEITVVMLSFNEAQHIERAIKSVQSFATRICVVDSHSSDKTPELVESLGGEVVQNKWVNYATQFNFGLKHFAPKSGWVMRLDSDEYVTEELANQIRQTLLQQPDDVTGITIRRRVIFKDKWIRFGGYYPTWLLRFWRAGVAHCENRWMDEHMVLARGKSVRVRLDIVDHNLNDISWWTKKHDAYAEREAVDVLNGLHEAFEVDQFSDKSGLSTDAQAQRKRQAKGYYARAPKFLRAWMYFVLRYVVQGGFLDGWRGLQWHTLQGLWYRMLVDVKIEELEAKAASQGKSMREYLIDEYAHGISR